MELHSQLKQLKVWHHSLASVYKLLCRCIKVQWLCRIKLCVKFR